MNDLEVIKAQLEILIERVRFGCCCGAVEAAEEHTGTDGRKVPATWKAMADNLVQRMPAPPGHARNLQLIGSWLTGPDELECWALALLDKSRRLRREEG